MTNSKQNNKAKGASSSRARSSSRGKPKHPTGKPRARIIRRGYKSRRLNLSNMARDDIRGLKVPTQCITLPHENPPMRFPTLNSIRKTGLLHLTTSGTITQDPSTGPEGEVDVGFICKSPSYPFWMSRWVTSNQGYSYTWLVPKSITPISVPRFPQSYTPMSDGSATPGWGTFDDRGWVYLPAGWGLAMSWIDTMVQTLTFQFQYMEKIGEIVQQSLVQVTSTVGAQAPVLFSGFTTGRWYNWVSMSQTVGPSSVSFALICKAIVSGYALLPVFNTLESASYPLVGNSLRLNASSLLLTNVSPELYKSGTVNCATLDSTATPVFDPVSMILQIGSRNASLKYVGPLAKGMYTFTVNEQSSATFDDYSFIDSALSVPVMRLEDLANVNAFYTQPNAGQPQAYQFVYDQHLEFITTSQLFNLGVSTMSLADYQMAMTAAGSIVPFTENPIHWAALAALGMKAIAALAPFLKPPAHKFVDYASRRAHGFINTM